MKIVIGTLVSVALVVLVWFFYRHTQWLLRPDEVYKSETSPKSLAAPQKEKVTTSTAYTQEDKSPLQRNESQVAQENRLPSGKTPSVSATPTSTSISTTNCVTPQGVRQDLLAQLRDKKLYKWFLRDSSSEHAKELGRVCLQSNLSREEIIALMGPPLFGGGSNGVAYSFAPSQLLEFQFDAQGKIIGAKITGVPIQPK